MIEIQSSGKFVGVATPIRCAALVLLSLCMVSGGAYADNLPGYHLGVMDKLHIRVAEWQTAEGTIRDWSTISGDYTVGPSGSVSVPFIGDMPAIGKTTDEIADAIGIGLQKQFGLRDRPSASVELSQFRPIYLAGEVQIRANIPSYPTSLSSRQSASVAVCTVPTPASGSRAISSMPRVMRSSSWRSAEDC